MIREIARKQVAVLIILGLLSLLVWGVILVQENNHHTLEVVFLDIGQGDAIFIETPNGTQVLIDGGPDKSVLRELGKVMHFWDRSLDMVIMSHPDLDHIAGLPSVFERFEVEYFMTPGVTADTGAYETLVQDVEKEGSQVLIAQQGRVWIDRDSGVYFDILFPDRDVSGVETNLASIVAKLVYGDTSFLFTGDSPQSIETYLAASMGGALDVDVLKLGHHGSKTSTSEEFLGYTSPDYAIISAGKDNRYGHPHREVLDTLERFNISYMNTAEVGRVVFRSDGQTVFTK
jgi:competence protein ComEC